MSELEIREILHRVFERLDRDIGVPVRRVAGPVALGAGLALTVSCTDPGSALPHPDSAYGIDLPYQDSSYGVDSPPTWDLNPPVDEEAVAPGLDPATSADVPDGAKGLD